MSPYISHTIKNVISVSRIVSFFKKDFDVSFSDVAEEHSFWEIVYVEKGSVKALSDGREIPLKSGDIYFHKPEESHMVVPLEKSTVYFISFYSRSKAMSLFGDTKLSLTPYLKNFIYELESEVLKSFMKTRKNNLHGLVPQETAPIGGTQLYRIYLESFLINLLRYKIDSGNTKVYSEKESFEADIAEKITAFISSALYSDFSIDALCKKLNYSRTFLCTLFKKENGVSINQYYITLKIDEAKKLISEGKLSLAEISEKLNFSSRYYFSKVFKKETGFTLSSYKKSLSHQKLSDK